jgi:hypothetical protein
VMMFDEYERADAPEIAIPAVSVMRGRYKPRPNGRLWRKLAPFGSRRNSSWLNRLTPPSASTCLPRIPTGGGGDSYVDPEFRNKLAGNVDVWAQPSAS